MKLIKQGKPNCCAVCLHKITPFGRDEIRKFTATLAERTGVSIPLAMYDENGTLRDLYLADGKHLLSYSRAGVLRTLYGEIGKKMAIWDKDGALCEIYAELDGKAKLLAMLCGGVLSALVDEAGKPLADVDAEGNVTAVRHPEGDALTEEDEEFAERAALAEARLAMAKALLNAVDERLAWAQTLIDFAGECHAAGREIVVGRMPSRPETLAAHGALPYTAYEVAAEGETIYVRALSEYLSGKAFSALAETAQPDEWILAEDFFLTGDDARVATLLPRFEAGELEGVYYCGNENYEISVRGADENDFDAYLARLEALGFTLYDQNTMVGARFATYLAPDEREGEIALFASFYPRRGVTKIVYGPRGYLPSTEPVTVEHAVRENLLLVQPERGCIYAGAPGMLYIIQLLDGSFILLDGGSADRMVARKVRRKGEWIELAPEMTHDKDMLYRFLCEHAPNGERPRIATWFITHPHGDHMGMATEFLRDYGDLVDIELSAMNLPDIPTTYTQPEPAGWRACAAPYSAQIERLGVTNCVLHTGQRYYYAGCEIEILYTQEDYYPLSFSWGNQMSCAFRMKVGEKTVMFLGDIEKINCQQMADEYGAYLKSDILQISHHGVNGACLDIYRHIDPEICLWPIDECRFSTNPQCLGTIDGYVFNRFIRDKRIRDRKHYHNGKDVSLEL